MPKIFSIYFSGYVRNSNISNACVYVHNLLQLLDTPILDQTFRRSLIVATQRLSDKSKLHPTCYVLDDVRLEGQDAVDAGGFSDIYKGDFKGRVVCIKAIRVYEAAEVKHLLKVSSPGPRWTCDLLRLPAQ